MELVQMCRANASTSAYTRISGSCRKAICLHKTGAERTRLPGGECCQSDFRASPSVLGGRPQCNQPHCHLARLPSRGWAKQKAGSSPTKRETGTGNRLEHNSVNRGMGAWGSEAKSPGTDLCGGAHGHIRICACRGPERCSVRTHPFLGGTAQVCLV